MPGIGVYNFTLKPEARKLDEVVVMGTVVLPGSGINRFGIFCRGC